MNRGDFQDSYDDDDDDDDDHSSSESSSSKKYSLFVEETETNECVNDEKSNRKHRGKMTIKWKQEKNPHILLSLWQILIDTRMSVPEI